MHNQGKIQCDDSKDYFSEDDMSDYEFEKLCRECAYNRKDAEDEQKLIQRYPYDIREN